MNSQNILKYYGSKLDLTLDSSEFYDFEISKTTNDFDIELIDLSTPITYSSLVFDSSCTFLPIDVIKPYEIEINEDFVGDEFDTCDTFIRKRTEKGWTLDFVFNRGGNSWEIGSTFYYWGIKSETNPKYYLDNNLSFSFTNDKRIKWESYRYSGYCLTNSGYTETSYISSGQTPVICSDTLNQDFSVTITFKRNYVLDDCDLDNRGGISDLITGKTLNNPLAVLTGATEDYDIVEVLNNKWKNERDKRLGTLKIYINSRLIYKLNNWEEIIPSKRDSTNSIYQIYGGGTDGSEDLHLGYTEFDIKQVKYFEEPLDYSNIRHHYLTSIKPNYDIYECSEECIDNITSFISNAILTEDDYVLTTEDNDILIY
jgi:hypothetical protein